MSQEKTMIAEAVSRLPLERGPELADVLAAAGGAEIKRIEPDCTSIHTVDCLFDGEATIILSDERALHATVFGRYDSRRVEVDRVVLDS